MKRSSATAGLLGVLLLVTNSCTGSYLYDERRTDQAPADRALSLEGSFCTLGTNEVVRPIKIFIAMDASLSMVYSDPHGTRAQAVIDLIENLPQDPEIYMSVMLFAGSTSVYMLGTDTDPFVELCKKPLVGNGPCTPMPANQKDTLIQRLQNFQKPPGDPNNPNRDATDFVKPLSEIYAAISRDLALTRNNSVTSSETAPRYNVIFLSDGHPTNPQDDQLLCPGDAVVRIRQLKDLADDVRLNTVHVFVPDQEPSSNCNLSLYDAGTSAGGSSCIIPQVDAQCPLLMVNQDAERLYRMSQLGGGDFRDFRNHEEVNFLSFKFGQVRRQFLFKELVATNFSAPPDSPLLLADTDGDGLTDDDEVNLYGTDPFRKDTDGDGFSDGVEVYFLARGGDFHPAQLGLPDGGGLDQGCPPTLRAKDSDCDGLLDCDEQLVGTNPTKSDSDDDGIPDGVEWQMHTQGSSKDLDQDPDTDLVDSRAEVRMHTDPLTVDNSKFSTVAYRYDLKEDGPVDDRGRQCFNFRVDNISLANTRADLRPPDAGIGLLPGTGTQPGFNEVYLAYTMKPGDDPNAKSIVRQFRTKTPRFPVGGIKSPVDGVIRVGPDDFIDRCGPSLTGTTP